MQYINRIFYRNGPRNFVNEEIRTFFPECAVRFADIPRLRARTEIWAEFHLPKHPDIVGYLRATYLEYEEKYLKNDRDRAGGYLVSYASRHYGEGRTWVLQAAKQHHLFRLTADHEGHLNRLSELSPYATIPMLGT